ncbi:hypothetical protein CCACVL1_06976 [Corchorus capsularis]|uniref:Uncharacterized protein n=1 Tax=Corchorus capsularis TaxID=210143 RepID=A0A1R3JAM6_COCAP|nr:hypothetical protein CCACVL1_06976 [Corchorus capsularis]
MVARDKAAARSCVARDGAVDGS